MAAAALPALAGAKAGADWSAGVIRTIIDGLYRPFYSYAETITVTHQARNGDVIVKTKTKGWTITVGFILGGLTLLAIWEFLMGWLQAGGPNGEGSSNPAENLGLLTLNPALWGVGEVFSLLKGSSQSIGIPPTAMSAINETVKQAMLPVLAAAQTGGGTLAGTIQEAVAKAMAQMGTA